MVAVVYNDAYKLPTTSRRLSGTTDKFSRTADTLGIGAYPVTFACWFRSDTVTANQSLISFGSSSNNGDYVGLWADGSLAGDPVRAIVSLSGSNNSAGTSTPYSANKWHHAAAVITASTLTVYKDGVSTSAANAKTWPTTNQVGVGVLQRLTPAIFFDGAIADVAVWAAALTSPEIQLLATGSVVPPRIRRASLAAYWPMGQRRGDEYDGLRRWTLFETGAPGVDVAPPRARSMSEKRLFLLPAAAGFQPAWAARSTVTIVGGVAA